MIKKVYVVFKTHLDLGFTGLAKDIEKKYLKEYFPAAIATANWFRNNHPQYRYIWTVGSWLICTGLEKLKGAQLRQLEKALEHGDIVWHALPFTMHTELCDKSLFEYALSLSQKLDARFGVKTVAAKMTDVPGHTRGIIGPMSNAGIKLLHIGVNPASAMPDVPELFKWQDTDGNSLWVIYQADYGQTLLLPQLDFALHVDVTGDNLGPHSPQQAIKVIEGLRKKFPAAEIIPARLDDFAAALIQAKPNIPIIHSEIGDTWIHGVGSDPAKISRFRELCRLRTRWLSEGVRQDSMETFSRKLLEVAEHTWGLDEKLFLPRERDYSKTALKKICKSSKGLFFEKSWKEQRNLLTSAVDALPIKLRVQAKDSLKKILPMKPSQKKFQVTPSTVLHDTEFFQVQFDRQTGAITHMVDKSTGRILADDNHRLFEFSYQTFSALDYRRFMGQYLRIRRRWALKDFAKPGLSLKKSLSKTYLPQCAELAHESDKKNHTFKFKLTMPDKAIREYGCPTEVFLEYEFSRTIPDINVKCQWFDKSAYRGAEALWLGVSPCVSQRVNCSMEKMSHFVSPTDVVSSGARGLYAVNGMVNFTDGDFVFSINSKDATLVAPGKSGLLDFANRKPDAFAGVQFNLYNNTWGTNFPMWYRDDAIFRFTLSAITNSGAYNAVD